MLGIKPMNAGWALNPLSQTPSPICTCFYWTCLTQEESVHNTKCFILWTEMFSEKLKYSKIFSDIIGGKDTMETLMYLQNLLRKLLYNCNRSWWKMSAKIIKQLNKWTQLPKRYIRILDGAKTKPYVIKRRYFRIRYIHLKNNLQGDGRQRSKARAWSLAVRNGFVLEFNH